MLKKIKRLKGDKMNNIYKGNFYYANLDPVIGSEQAGIRPVIVLQNNVGNKNSPTVIIAPITAKEHCKNNLPTHVEISAFDGIVNDSIILLEQVRTIDKKRLKNFLGRINIEDLWKVEKALVVAFGINIKKIMEDRG